VAQLATPRKPTRYAEAEGIYREVLRLDPSFLPARQKLWIAYALEGKTQQAGEELENLMRLLDHRDVLGRVKSTQPAERYRQEVEAYIQSGLLSPYERARYLALLGRGPEAVKALMDAKAEQSAWIVYLRIEPAFDGIRGTPAFEELLRAANIPPSAPLER
jgi:tetratricopeptide (TPR) repeat protein